MTTVLITGARGFIARELARVLQGRGARVAGSSRTPGAAPGFDAIYPAALGESLGPALAAERVDAVVHTALEPGAASYDTNVAGTTRWLEEAAAAQAARAPVQLLLSSLSADANALADYGRAKHALEERFLAAGQTVFRLGVVVGKGGMYARMVQTARRAPVIPLLDSGRQLIYVVGVRTLCNIIADTVLGDGAAGLRGVALNLQQPEPYTLREVMAGITRRHGRRILLPVPAAPFLPLLTLIERQSLVRLPITSTNIKGLIQGGQRRWPSDFTRFSYPAQSLDELIEEAA